MAFRRLAVAAAAAAAVASASASPALLPRTLPSLPSTTGLHGGLVDAPAAGRQMQGCNGTAWDFLMLVTQWAVTECMDVYSCNASWQFFTLHDPCTCTDQAFNPADITSIMTAMNTYWPSLNGPNADFWSHEWSKHGTCALNILPSQYDFFSTTLNLLNKYDTTAALAAKSIYPSNTKDFSVSAFRSATSAAFGAPAIVNCDSNGNIEEVALCLDAQLTPITCPPSITDACSSSSLYLPSSVH